MSDLSFMILHADGSATALRGLPLTHPTVIAFTADIGQEANAAELSNSVCDFLFGSGLNVKACAPQCSHDADGIPACPLCSQKQSLQLLVVLGRSDLAAAITPFSIPNLTWWTTSGETRRVLPVFKSGTHPEQILPPAIAILNAAFWQGTPAEITSTVLSAAQVSPESYRIFISYRRLETEALAEDFFETLNRLGFDVFLDRFSVPAAVNFQRRLHQDLGQKAMVLLLESDRFGESTWTTEEITYCKRHELGLYSLRIPWGMAGQATPTRNLSGIPDDWREDLTRAHFEADPVSIRFEGSDYLQWGRLTAAARTEFGLKMRTRHDAAILRRRENMRTQMIVELARSRKFSQAAGDATPVEYAQRADGLVSVRSKKNTSYTIWVTPRPPELPDFHATHTGCQFPPNTTGVIVGLQSLLEPEMQRRLEWLSGVCKLVLVDQGHIVAACHEIAEGTL